MNGPIAQAAALVVYGNEILQGRGWPMFWPKAHVFDYCKYVRFLESPASPPSAPPVASDPSAWLSMSRANQTSGLRLHYAANKRAIGSDRELAGLVGGGGRWLLEAITRQDSALWEARWRVGAKDERGAIWEVDYACVDAHWPYFPSTDRSPDVLRTNLRDTLTSISAFATRNDLQNFATAFNEALTCLDAETPLAKTWGGDFEHATLLPLAAQQLIGAAAAAWVFGGMGSWNDQGFEGAAQQDYTRLSDTLFAQLCEAICAAVNAGSAAAPQRA